MPRNASLRCARLRSALAPPENGLFYLECALFVVSNYARHRISPANGLAASLVDKQSAVEKLNSKHSHTNTNRQS